VEKAKRGPNHSLCDEALNLFVKSWKSWIKGGKDAG